MNKKIFIGNKEICFTPKLLKVNSPQKNQLDIFVENKAEMKLIFEFFVYSKKYLRLNLIGQMDKSFKLFCSLFTQIEAAGGVISNTKAQVLFIYRLKKWDLPKGKIEKGEGKQRAAIRECEEECGIKGLKVIGKLEDSWHMYKVNNQWILKKTYWFLMNTNFQGRLLPQKEEGITKSVWISKLESKKIIRNTYPAIKLVLKQSQFLS